MVVTHLVAILLNPKLGGGPSTSSRNIKTAAELLGASTQEIVNLSLVPTLDGPGLNLEATGRDVWTPAQPLISDAITRADLILAGWGRQQFTRGARQGFSMQEIWVIDRLRKQGFESVFTLDGAPRHPSRWRMYLGPQRGIHMGGSFEDRLRRALTFTHLTELE